MKDMTSRDDDKYTPGEDPDFEAKLRRALEIPVPALKMPALPPIDIDADSNKESYGHSSPEFEDRILRALTIPVPALKMPELPPIAADASHDGDVDAPTTPEFEDKILRALTIPVPELKMPELPPIETDNVVTLSSRRRVSTPTWFAMAASLALVAIIGVQMFGTTPRFESLADEIVAHLDHEPNATRVTDTPVSDGKLSRVVPSSMANLNHDAGLITYAKSCEINGNKVPHLVIQGKNGPVTVILLPDERVSVAETLEGEGINGVLIPVGDGSIAIIGDKDEDVEAIQESVVNSVMWST